MKKISENKPSNIEFTANNETIFNWNIMPIEGGYEYDSILCAGEPTRYNILRSLLGDIYTQEQLDYFDGSEHSVSDQETQDFLDYNNDYNLYNSIISDELGSDFDHYDFETSSFSYSESENGNVVSIEQIRANKIYEIEAYDVSDNVNGFFYNGQFMWLDRITRAVLANTINSAELLGEETINIWYKDTVCVNIGIENAKMLLASLEMYATACYNITANHKSAVRNMNDVDSIMSFDVTADYPSRLEFNI